MLRGIKDRDRAARAMMIAAVTRRIGGVLHWADHWPSGRLRPGIARSTDCRGVWFLPQAACFFSHGT